MFIGVENEMTHRETILGAQLRECLWNLNYNFFLLFVAAHSEKKREKMINDDFYAVYIK